MLGNQSIVLFNFGHMVRKGDWVNMTVAPFYKKYKYNKTVYSLYFYT